MCEDARMFAHPRALARKAVEVLDRGSSGAIDFASWEFRATLRWSAQGLVSWEGESAGVVRRAGRDGAARDERRVIGVGPAHLARLLAAPGVSSRTEHWADDLERIRRDVLEAVAEWEVARARADEGRASRDVGTTESTAAAALHLRVRAWRRAGESGQTEVAAGVSIRCGKSTEIAVAPTDFLFDMTTAPGAAAAQIGDTCALRPPSIEFAPDADTPPFSSGWCGPVVFDARAAGWIAHEFGHAAFEATSGAGEPVPLNAEHGAILVDDPTAVAWPVGFGVDDEGRPSSKRVLWGPTGPVRNASESAPRRRGSLGQPCLPALTYTHLAVPERECFESPPPDGTPVIVDVSSARFDPASGLILALATLTGQVREGRTTNLRQAPVLVWFDPRRVWPRLAAVGSTTAPSRFIARCSRLGSMHPVMVGAPTIVLDPVHLAPGDPAPDAGGRGPR